MVAKAGEHDPTGGAPTDETAGRGPAWARPLASALAKRTAAPPTDGPPPTVLKELKLRIKHDGLSDVAAGVAFWSFLSLFPAILAFVSMLGSMELLVGESNADKARSNVTDWVERSLPKASFGQLRTAILDLLTKPQGGIAVIAIALALWSMSKGFAGLCRALARLEGDITTRLGLKGRVVALGLGAGTVLVVIVVLLQSVIGPLFGAEKLLGDGAGHVLLDLWSILRWPLFVALVLTWIAGLLKIGGASPDRLRTLLPGAALIAVSWVLVTALVAGGIAFGLLKANPVLGPIGSVILFLTWLHLMSFVTLIGATFNAVRRARRSGRMLVLPGDDPALLETGPA